MTTVADLYTQVLGRVPDAGGLAYWEKMFGANVDPTEAATFKSVAQVTEPEKVASVVANLVNQIDPSSAISADLAARTPAAGMPTTVTDFYKQFYGSANTDPSGLAYWQSKFGGNQIDPLQASILINEASKSNPNAATGLTVEDAFSKYLGGNTDQAGINFWKQQFGDGNISVGQLAQLTNTQSGINTDTGGGLLGTGIGPDVNWTSIRDPLEAAGVIAGNYVLPGSSLVSSRLVSEGAKEQLATPAGMLANIGAGVAGGMDGNLDNYGKIIPGSSGLEGVTQEQLAAANATDDPIASLNAIKGWTNADIGYLSSVGGMTPEILSAANYNNALLSGLATASGAGTGLTASQVIKAIPLVTTANALVGDPLGLQPKTTTPTTTTGFGVVPIPEGWKPPTSAQSTYQPIDLNSIFTDQNLLAGTKWQGLPNQRNMTFNDIFSSGQQSTPMGTPVNINNLVSEILGQTATSQKPA